jgi:hypothetical protein
MIATDRRLAARIGRLIASAYSRPKPLAMERVTGAYLPVFDLTESPMSRPDPLSSAQSRRPQGIAI